MIVPQSSHPLMRAAILDAPGVPFRIAEVPRPVPEAGQLLVRIAASSVNPLDTKIHLGQAAHARHPLPAILGIDLAGTVVELGEGVSAFRPGDAVFGMTGGVGGLSGSLAEFVAVDAELLAPKPSTLTMRAAAALPLAVITAWEGLVDRASLQAGDSVLVLGGAGGVGHVVVQIARAMGARVFAVDGAQKAAFLEHLGATAIDRDDPLETVLDRWTGGRGFDLVYDTVGGPVLDLAFRAVRRHGHVVSALGWGTHALAPLSFQAASYSGIFTLLPLLTGEGRAHHGAILRHAGRMAEAGQLAPRLDPRRFHLGEVDEAYRLLRDGGAQGKLVIETDPGEAGGT